MKLEEPTAAYTVNSTVDPLVARAEELVREFPQCFWSLNTIPRICNREDVMFVVQRLRTYGDQQAWLCAQQLYKSLKFPVEGNIAPITNPDI